jgi:hypothetical protein
MASVPCPECGTDNICADCFERVLWAIKQEMVEWYSRNDPMRVLFPATEIKDEA